MKRKAARSALARRRTSHGVRERERTEPEPVERLCTWCSEPVESESQQHPAFMEPMHLQCGIRVAIGSVAHIEGRCGCFIEGSEEGDPPGMTLREAARAAFEAWENRRGR